MTSTEEKLMQLNRKVVQLFQEEKYSEAIKLGLQALEMGKKTGFQASQYRHRHQQPGITV